MKAGILESIENLVVREVPKPELKRGSVIIKVKACSICASDLRSYHYGHLGVELPQILGHEIAGEVETVGEGVTSYRPGDRYLDAARGKSNQPAVFLDATGRSYSLSAHTLPSARGYGEPLTGRFVLPPGATITSVLMAPSNRKLLMASDAGYGFITRFEDLVTRNTKGKAVLTLPKGARPLRPVLLDDNSGNLLAAVTNEGRMLVFPLNKLPALAKGKGNKIIQIPPKRARSREELLTHLVLVPEGGTLVIHAGKRFFKLTYGNLAQYMGERGRRGKKLPRGFQNVDWLESQAPVQAPLELGENMNGQETES